MKMLLLLFLSLFITANCFSQQTKIFGKVIDASTKKPIDYARVGFTQSDVGTFTDQNGNFSITTYYASDTLVVSSFGYQTIRQKIEVGQSQELNFKLEVSKSQLDAVVIKMTGDSPAIRILKKVIRNKPTNNKEKLDSYEYESYTKTQFDVNNLWKDFESSDIIKKKLGVILDYIDSSNKKQGIVLPILLTETLSDFYYQKNPRKKKEVLKASRVTGVEQIQLNQVLGDNFVDFNFYDNNINLFQHSFISPISDYGKNFYNYTLIDSSYIDNGFYYLINFKPKMSGGTTFEGSMWIHDTTYALKEIKATLSSVANINFINGMYIDQQFSQVQKEVWMMTDEHLLVDLKLTRNTKLFGILVRKTTNRSKFKINVQHPPEFYKSNSTIVTEDGAENRDQAYWDSVRHMPLNKTEQGVIDMNDSLHKIKFFNNMTSLMKMLTTGYFPIGNVEIGNLLKVVNTNPIEKFRLSFALRTSNQFSKRIELGGNIGYGFGDKALKGGGLIRINITPKKRGLLRIYANSDLEQYAEDPDLNNIFASALRLHKPDKLFYVNKIGTDLEKDISKDFIFTVGVENRQIRSLGLAKFERLLPNSTLENINILKTTELKFGVSWGHDRQYINSVFSRALLSSYYPIISLNTTFGLKGILGSQFNYQQIELGVEQERSIGVLGRIHYRLTAGKYFGNSAYPFLHIHLGSETLWFSQSTFNMMHYFDYISDTYASAYVEHHFQGLLFNRIPLIKKLKWRLVIHGQADWGSISQKNQQILLPANTKLFGRIPYVEVGVGIENIFKFFRIDFVYRATHQVPGEKPFGLRFRLNFQL